MKATLVIEVPDDFKKHDCEHCPISVIEDIMFDYTYVCPYETQQCPLKLEGEK